MLKRNGLLVLALAVIALLLTYAAPAEEVQPTQSEIARLESKDLLTGVLITQCNMIIAAYMTTTDGRLVRFDVRDQTQMSASALQTLVYSARVSERIELRCDGTTFGTERHENPIS